MLSILVNKLNVLGLIFIVWYQVLHCLLDVDNVVNWQYWVPNDIKQFSQLGIFAFLPQATVHHFVLDLLKVHVVDVEVEERTVEGQLVRILLEVFVSGVCAQRDYQFVDVFVLMIWVDL